MTALTGSPVYAQLEEVVVTARKREENLQQVPVAVTAYSSEAIGEKDLTNIEKIGAETPGLYVVRGANGSGASVSLRGIGPNYTSVGIEQSVAVVADGVYYGSGRILNEGFFDMDRVEILKGPQSLFFGKNATAGVISFTSKNPGDHFEASTRADYEFYARQVALEAVASGPITDSFGLRLAISASDMFGGYVQNQGADPFFKTFDIATGTASQYAIPSPEKDLPGDRNLVGRLTGKFTLTDALNITVKATGDRYRNDNSTWNDEIYLCPRGGFAQSDPALTCNKDWRIRNADLPAQIASGNRLLDKHGGQLYQDYDSYASTAAVDYRIPDELIVNWITGFHHLENQFLGNFTYSGAQGGVFAGEDSRYSAMSSELRGQTSFAGPVNLMVGAYFQSMKQDFEQDIIFNGAAHLVDSSQMDAALRNLTVIKMGRTNGRTWAGFSQLNWKLVENWELDAGARYTHETKDSYLLQPYVVDFPLLRGIFTQFDPANGNSRFAEGQTFVNTSPEVTLTWRPSTDFTLYGAYKEGFKSGGFSISSLVLVNSKLTDFAFNPETAKGFEFGLRSTLLDGTLRLNTTVYDYRYDNYQVDFFDSTTFRQATYNAASAQTSGLEIEATWVPPSARGLTLSATADYDAAKYTSFRNAPCASGQTPAQGCTLDSTGLPVQDLTGASTALAPKWTGLVSADYVVPILPHWILGVSGSLHLSSSYATGAFGNFAADHQGSYSTFDGSVRVATEDRRWELSLLGKNLTNRYVIVSGRDAPGSGSATGTPAGIPADQQAIMQPPRTLALQLAWRY